ncbi:glycerophosphodiester phosphodiesterase [Amniculibacterium sp. G2-70]|uniref:glycerophosphodiester phosphodiesterase n=1 Tax=Amniculibacterium sp. G2-70 TaxID=2767188 RepID=UPI001654A9B6|nr:glycerophosphodiester phosphodiesterase family protein [Amniculibacterium sp. G2-70]
MRNQPKIIAHRGFFKSEPPTSENSLQSLKNAQQLPIFGSEFDIRLTKDHRLLVFHDEYFENWKISHSDLEFLKALKLSNNEGLPAFEDFLLQGKKTPKFKLVIELKPPVEEDLKKIMVEKCLNLITEKKMEDQVILISFSINICETIKKINPQIHVQYLKGDLNPKEVSDLGIDGINYHYSVFLDQPSWIEDAKNLNLSTNSWTVNEVEIYKKLNLMNIDQITTDYPNLFIDIINENQ